MAFHDASLSRSGTSHKLHATRCHYYYCMACILTNLMQCKLCHNLLEQPALVCIMSNRADLKRGQSRAGQLARQQWQQSRQQPRGPLLYSARSTLVHRTAAASRPHWIVSMPTQASSPYNHHPRLSRSRGRSRWHIASTRNTTATSRNGAVADSVHMPLHSLFTRQTMLQCQPQSHRLIAAVMKLITDIAWRPAAKALGSD